MSKYPYRVLFFSQTSNLFGGSQRSLLTYLKHVDRNIIQPTVVLPGEGSLTDALIAEDIPVILVRHGSWISKRQNVVKLMARITQQAFINLSSYLKLRRILREMPLDLVYSNTLVSPVGALIAQYKGCPHIWHAREFVKEDLDAIYNWGTKRSMRFIDNTTTRIICNSRATQNKLENYISLDKFEVVYNGFPELDNLSASKREPLASGLRVRLGIIGHVQPHKGHVYAVEALGSIVKQGVDAELIIAGKGVPDYVDAINQLAKELAIEDRIIWKGYVDDMAELYQQIDILLICSRAEPFGRTAVEALSYGCPVIGANNGGLPEIIQDGYNGLLFEPENSAALGEQITHLINNSILYESISANAFASIYPRFSVSQYIDGITRTIEQVISESS